MGEETEFEWGREFDFEYESEGEVIKVWYAFLTLFLTFVGWETEDANLLDGGLPERSLGHHSGASR